MRDLGVTFGVEGQGDDRATHVSSVIPTLNEAECLGRTLRLLSLLEPPAWEVLVVDGGSEDETVAIALKAGVKVLTSGRGRAVQMNEGAEVATGEVLCFLHADTYVLWRFTGIP